MTAITEANAAVSNAPNAPFALTAATFADHVQQPGILVVDFWAQWCGPCRAFAPVFEGAAKRHVDVRWAKVDTDAEPELSEALAIRSIPTLMIFRDGILVFAQPGMVSAPALDALVEKVRSLDMDKVKASARPVRSR